MQRVSKLQRGQEMKYEFYVLYRQYRDNKGTMEVFATWHDAIHAIKRWAVDGGIKLGKLKLNKLDRNCDFVWTTDGKEGFHLQRLNKESVERIKVAEMFKYSRTTDGRHEKNE